MIILKYLARAILFPILVAIAIIGFVASLFKLAYDEGELYAGAFKRGENWFVRFFEWLE